MLNRRILRVKVFKVLYSRYICPELSYESAKSQLNLSLESSRTLYYYILSMVAPLTEVAAKRIEDLKSLSTAEKGVADPNVKFAENLLAKYLTSDPDFKKAAASLPSWANYDIFLKRLYSDILTRDYYKEYLASGKSCLDEDCALFAKIFRNEFEDREEFLDILETTTVERKKSDDETLFWNDDAYYCLAYAAKVLSKKGFRFEVPRLFVSDSDPSKQSDREFTFNLLEKAFVGFESYRDTLMSFVPDTRFKDKVNSVDICLCLTALAEIVAFPEIPVKVSINEYLEISKYFGSEQSTAFVNGLLSTAIKKFQEDGLVVKTGAGLL